MHTTACSFTLRKNAKRAAEAKIRKGTAPAVDYAVKPQRIETVVAAVADRERVIAGVDCGFGTFVGWEWVTEEVVWAKLATLSAGAEIASKRLWSRKVA